MTSIADFSKYSDRKVENVIEATHISRMPIHRALIMLLAAIMRWELVITITANLEKDKTTLRVKAHRKNKSPE